MTEQDDPTGVGQPPPGQEYWMTPPPGVYARQVDPSMLAYGPLPRSHGLPYETYAPRRRAPGILAGILVLAVAGGGVAYLASRHDLPISGAFAGAGSPADTSATHRDSGSGPPSTAVTPTPAPSRTQDPVLSVEQVAAVVTPGVVVITSDLGTQNAEAAGTGMVLTPTGEILTNNHVVVGATHISVTVVNTHQQFVADVVGTSPANDVALLRLRGATGLSTIPLGNSDTVSEGQNVVAVGNAGGRGTLSVVSGTVTSTDQTITATDQNGGNRERLSGMIAAEADIEAGDSGGPLANRAGRVIGMNTAASTSNGRQNGGPGEPTYGFAIPINRALTVAEGIRSSAAQTATRGYLGVRVANTPASGGGAMVESITAGSPAEQAGLRAGDIVTTLDSDPVGSPGGLTESLKATHPGQQVTVGWTEPGGRQRTASVVLGDGPPD